MPFRPNTNPRRAPKGPKAGSVSPKHRGYRPEEAPTKNRWNADERASRRGDAGGERENRRPDWTPPENRPQRPGKAAGAERRARQEQNFRGQGGRDDRGFSRDDRGGRGDDRGGYQRRDDRGGYQGRDDRGGFRGRDDRAPRDERGGFKRDDRGGRDFDGRGASRDDRGAGRGRDTRGGYQGRDDRGGFRGRDDRAPREDRGGYQRDDRGARGFGSRDDRFAGQDRDARAGYQGRDDRGGFRRDDRGGRDFAGRGDQRDDRGARGFRGRDDARDDRAERGARSWQPDERPTRQSRFSRDDRPAERSTRTDGAYREDRQARDRSRERTDEYSREVRAARDTRPARIDRMGDVDRTAQRSNFYGESRTAGQIEDVVLERLEATATTADEVDGVTFGDLGLGTNIVRVLGELGAEHPFPIQAATIPDVLAGRNVLGRGRTGSGKTIAFGSPLVERLMENGGGTKREMGRAPRALILAPTRELALQIDRTVQPIARSVGLFTTQIYGGVPQQRQVGALNRGVDIIIGTPGRIEDLEAQGHLDLSRIQVVVLDEADHMCDLGFLEPVQRIMRMTRPDGQRLLFSATLDTGVAKLVDEFLPNPSVHEVAGEDQASSTIDHRLLLIDQRDKIELIAELSDAPGKTLIFARTRAFAEQLAEELADRGVPATSLHGDLNQARRTRSLERLTSGKVDVLVATDVAARGIHVDDITMVIQADMPEEYKTYLHRAGRTGRAGKQGTVVTLIGKSRRRKMEELLTRAEIEVTATDVRPGDETIKALVRG